jgi:uncharacterized protein
MNSSTLRTGIIGAAAIAALSLLVVVVAGWGPTNQITVQNPGVGEQTGIAVTGQGKVSVRPDIARVSIGIETRAATVAEAREEAAQAMNAVRDAILGEGVAERDIQTRGLHIYPDYDYSDRQTPRITGYVVNNHIEVTIRDIDNTSAIIDNAIVAGGDAARMHGISFTVDNPEEHLSAAREAAVQQARQRASVLATAGGVTLGSVRSISEATGGFHAPPMPGMDRSFQEDFAGAPTPIEPGEQELVITVAVVFDIQR